MQSHRSLTRRRLRFVFRSRTRKPTARPAAWPWQAYGASSRFLASHALVSPSPSTPRAVLSDRGSLESIRIVHLLVRTRRRLPPGQVQSHRGTRHLHRLVPHRMADHARSAHGDGCGRAAGRHHARQRADQGRHGRLVPHRRSGARRHGGAGDRQCRDRIGGVAEQRCARFSTRSTGIIVSNAEPSTRSTTYEGAGTISSDARRRTNWSPSRAASRRAPHDDRAWRSRSSMQRAMAQ